MKLQPTQFTPRDVMDLLPYWLLGAYKVGQPVIAAPKNAVRVFNGTFWTVYDVPKRLSLRVFKCALRHYHKRKGVLPSVTKLGYRKYRIEF